MYKSNEIKMKTQAGMKLGANGTSQHYKEPGQYKIKTICTDYTILV